MYVLEIAGCSLVTGIVVFVITCLATASGRRSAVEDAYKRGYEDGMKAFRVGK